MRHQQKIIEISRFLVSIDEHVASEWAFQKIEKPYEKNIDKVQSLSEEVVKSILKL
jgi:hypothetical protein